MNSMPYFHIEKNIVIIIIIIIMIIIVGVVKANEPNLLKEYASHLELMDNLGTL